MAFAEGIDMAIIEESWVGVGVLSEACLFIPKGSFHLLLLIAIVLALTRRDLVGRAVSGLPEDCKLGWTRIGR
jgi:hypothetical protein